MVLYLHTLHLLSIFLKLSLPIITILLHEKQAARMTLSSNFTAFPQNATFLYFLGYNDTKKGERSVSF